MSRSVAVVTLKCGIPGLGAQLGARLDVRGKVIVGSDNNLPVKGAGDAKPQRLFVRIPYLTKDIHNILKIVLPNNWLVLFLIRLQYPVPLILLQVV